MSIYDMGNASNEARLQNIMRLKRAVKNGQVVTVKSAMNMFGYTRNTIIKWAVDGQVPLYDTEKHQWIGGKAN